MQAFAIGSFYFACKQEPPFQFITGKFVDAIEKSLSALPAASEVEIDYAEEFSTNTLVTSIAEEDDEYFQSVMFLRISFLLYIPKRVQLEVIEDQSGHIDTGTENFRVLMYGTYDAPVSYVECLNPSEDCSPSTAVRVIREYLRRELKGRHELIDFECLGPSPFHKDFYIDSESSAEQNTDEIEFNEIRMAGYNSVRIKFAHRDSDRDEIIAVAHKFNQELGLFYSLVRQRRARNAAWRMLTSRWESLREITDPSPGFFNIKRRYKIYIECKSLISQSYAFKASDAIKIQAANVQISERYAKGLKTYFQAAIDLENNNTLELPTQTIIDWAMHVHDTTFKGAEIVTLLVSAIVGGVVGAVITKVVG